MVDPRLEPNVFTLLKLVRYLNAHVENTEIYIHNQRSKRARFATSTRPGLSIHGRSAQVDNTSAEQRKIMASYTIPLGKRTSVTLNIRSP